MKKNLLLAALVIVAASSGCSSVEPTARSASMAATGPKATATLEPTKGNTAAGTVTFQQQGDQVVVTAKLSGLKPNQEHGFHAHEKGDCSSGDGMSTGGHFNPTAKAHGPQDAEHHAGDMPGLKSDAGGNVDAKFNLTGVGIGSGSADLVGRGLIVHAAADDYKTQPTGNSGARIACGVIRQG
ncbi:MAG TPA: superoxide dismutase family protein [Albitalea sp.]|jgi:Cu-Zn family superoxide dismutase|nr:superoxide dismutase family protein [Albitalea sp.]